MDTQEVPIVESLKGEDVARQRWEVGAKVFSQMGELGAINLPANAFDDIKADIQEALTGAKAYYDSAIGRVGDDEVTRTALFNEKERVESALSIFSTPEDQRNMSNFNFAGGLVNMRNFLLPPQLLTEAERVSGDDQSEIVNRHRRAVGNLVRAFGVNADDSRNKGLKDPINIDQFPHLR